MPLWNLQEGVIGITIVLWMKRKYATTKISEALPNKTTIANEKIRLIKGDEIKRG